MTKLQDNLDEEDDSKDEEEFEDISSDEMAEEDQEDSINFDKNCVERIQLKSIVFNDDIDFNKYQRN